jgi:hypothetical protein
VRQLPPVSPVSAAAVDVVEQPAAVVVHDTADDDAGHSWMVFLFSSDLEGR